MMLLNKKISIELIIYFNKILKQNKKKLLPIDIKFFLQWLNKKYFLILIEKIYLFYVVYK